MDNKQKDLFGNDDTSENKDEKSKPQEKFTKPSRKGVVEYIEIEVDKFDFSGFQIVRKEFLSKANCPAVTFRCGSLIFNLCAIRKLDECSHIQILIDPAKKLMIAKPCGEDEKDSSQWSRIDKHGKLKTRAITGKVFTAMLYKDMKWDTEAIFKMLGKLIKCRGEKIFLFDLNHAEAYLSLSAPSADHPNRRERVPFIPEHWQGTYGQSYEESKNQTIETFEGVPEGFVKINIPQKTPKKPTGNKDLETPDAEKTKEDTANSGNSNDNDKEETEDGRE